MNTFEFSAGLILGAVLGVVADRLWAGYEQRPLMQLTAGWFTKINKIRGITYTVRNIGRSEIPEYKIGLFHPLHGIVFAFSSEQDGPLLPDQVRQHECPLFVDGRATDFINFWRSRADSQGKCTSEENGFELRVVMVNSERILFSSKRMGKALARVWSTAVRNGNSHDFQAGDLQAMSSRLPWGLRHWRDRYLHKRRLQKMLASQRPAEK